MRHGRPASGELRHAFIENAGGGQSERTVDDVGVAGDPADVGHTPVNVGGMDVLIELGSARGVGQIAAGAMLAALRLSGGAAGVHQEKRIFCFHRNGRNNLITDNFSALRR